MILAKTAFKLANKVPEVFKKYKSSCWKRPTKQESLWLLDNLIKCQAVFGYTELIIVEFMLPTNKTEALEVIEVLRRFGYTVNFVDSQTWKIKWKTE